LDLCKNPVVVIMTDCYDVFPCPNHKNVTVSRRDGEREVSVNFKSVRCGRGRNMNDSRYIVFGFNKGNIELEIVRQMTREGGETIASRLLLNIFVDAEELLMSEPGGT
jgi:predicted RNA-binding Zn-ribbon protein involved in translation (DUF1610 family)